MNRGGGVLRLQKDGSFIQDTSLYSRLPGSEGPAIYPDSMGNIWYGRPEGVFMFKTESKQHIDAQDY